MATNVTNGQKPNINMTFSHFRLTANEILDLLETESDSWLEDEDVEDHIDVILMPPIEKGEWALGNCG